MEKLNSSGCPYPKQLAQFCPDVRNVSINLPMVFKL